MDTTGEAHTGLLTGQDLAGWRATVEEPLMLDYGDYTVCKPGPWAQSPVLLQQLALLRGLRRRRDGSGRAGLRPHGAGVREARVRRPGRVLRRPAVRRRAARDAAVRGRTTPSAGGWSARRRRSSCARDDRRPRRRSRAAGGRLDADRASGDGHGRRDGGGHDAHLGAVRGADARRHVPPRHHRPARQHDLGHAERRLAVGLAGRPGPRLPGVGARPDVLARPGASERDRAGQAAADDAHARRSRCAAASRIWRSARRAATCRTSGRCTPSCGTCTTA